MREWQVRCLGRAIPVVRLYECGISMRMHEKVCKKCLEHGRCSVGVVQYEMQRMKNVNAKMHVFVCLK